MKYCHKCIGRSRESDSMLSRGTTMVKKESIAALTGGQVLVILALV